MQIAKLFASLGFEVDYSQVNAFEARLKTAQKEIKDFAREANNSNRKLQGMVEKLRNINKAFENLNTKKTGGKFHQSTKDYGKQVGKLVATSMKLETTAPIIEKAIERLGKVASENAVTWYNYGIGVDNAKNKLEELLKTIREIRTLGGGRTTITVGGGSGGARGGAGRPSGGAGQPPPDDDGGGGFLPLLFGGQKFLKPMLGSMMMGGALGSGYAVKELVQTGRDMDSMIFKLKAITGSTDEFNRSLNFVKNTSQDLAVDVEEVGNAYAQIFQGTKKKYNNQQVESMFSGFMKYFKTLKMSKEDIKGALRGISQMFGKNAIQA